MFLALEVLLVGLSIIGGKVGLSIEESIINVKASALERATVELEEYCPQRVELVKRTLMGRFMTDRLVNRGGANAILPKAWGTYEKMEVSGLGPNMFMFTLKMLKGQLITSL